MNRRIVDLNKYFIEKTHPYFYHIDYNSRILNSYVFKKLKILDLNGPINSIQFDLFKSFELLDIF